VRVFRVDLRGAGAGARLARRSYHIGLSTDLRAVLSAVAQWCPGAPLWLVGFSLGGNLVLKLAAEAAQTPVPGLVGVAAANPALDPAAGADLLDLPSNRVYNRYFADLLVAIARKRHRWLPFTALPRFPRNLSLRQFDDLYTAPRWGYADSAAYYTANGAALLVNQIQVPTFILHARDDPFIALPPFERIAPRPGLTLELTDHGGHLGFLGPDGNGGVRWAERRMAAWLLPRMFADRAFA
jgi:hypothetical protein